MKRWIIYLFVFAGLHIFYFYTSKVSIQEYETAEIYQSSGITAPNWSNPIAGDIFIVIDSSASINYYKIASGSNFENLNVLPGKFTFQSEDGKNIYDDMWTYEFVNSDLLYADTLQRYTLDEFNTLKKNAQLTHGFRFHPPKKPWDIHPFFFFPYQLIIHSVISFFVIWLFGYLSAYLPGITSLSKKLIWITLTTILIFTLIEFAERLSGLADLRFPAYTKFLIITLGLVVGLKYIKNRWLYKLKFFDQEAAKFVFILITSLTLSIFATLIQVSLGISTFPEPQNVYNFNFIGKLIYEIGPLSLVFCIAIATGNFLNNFRMHFFNLRKEAKALKAAQKNELKFQSEIESLQAKINPHFLYNSLNSIASLAQEDPTKTEEMALALSNFYKDTTNRQDQHTVSVEDEMNLLQTYLKIEKIRFGDRLEVLFDCDESIKTQEIPRFLLQPLVENAIKYGYNADENKTFVKIVANKLEDKLVFRIIDHGPKFPDDLGTGYGLRSVQKKLKLFYPEKHQLAFINNPEKQVYIEIDV